MNTSFNINVSGGNVSLGAASQGDVASITGTSTMHDSIESASEELFKTLEALAQRAGAAPDARSAVQSQARELVEAGKSQDTSRMSAALALIQKNFSWAYPALKDFVKASWPALLAAMGS